MGTVYRSISFGEKKRIGFFWGDADGFFKAILLPIIRIAGEIGFFREFIEGNEGYCLPQVIFIPFVVVVFYEAAGVGAGDEVVVIKRGVDDDVIDVVEKGFRGRELRPGRPGGDGLGIYSYFCHQ